MDCNTPISFENIIRSSIRTNGDCYALGVNSDQITSVDGCDGRMLLEKIGSAFKSTNVLLTQIGSGGGVAPTCDDVYERPTSELLAHVLLPGDSGVYVFQLDQTATPPDDACAQDCGGSEVPTETLLRGTFLKCAGCNDGWALQFVDVANPGEFDCTMTELPTETLLRKCIIDVGDGTYAFRIAQISAFGDFNNDFSNDFNIQ